MLDRHEYHRLKSLEPWIDQALKGHSEAWAALHALIEAHEHENCGAIEVAHSFTGVTIIALQLLQYQIEGVINQDDAIADDSAREPEEKDEKECTSRLVGVMQSWFAVNQGLIGLESAYTHVGHEIPLEAPPCSIEPSDDRPVVTDNIPEPVDGSGVEH